MTDTTTDPPRPLTVAYLGNFTAEHSTENHVARAWENNGHTVIRFQEQDHDAWIGLIELLINGPYPDLVLWTSTASYAAQIPVIIQNQMLHVALHAGVPTVGFHLDRWWGLDRQTRITEERAPFFSVELLVTADGGHEKQWVEHGINHLWMPPGVSRNEALREPSDRAGRYGRYQVAFVGSWGSYHPEWLPYRQQLVGHLQDWYGDRLLLVEGGLRGQGLVDLYRTVPVIVGDSCLAPKDQREYKPGSIEAPCKMEFYWSDRVPETLGRGGYLVHPRVQGLYEHYTEITDEGRSYCGPMTYDLGDWDELHRVIEFALGNQKHRTDLIDLARPFVLKQHTYERRMEQLMVELEARKMLPSVTA